MEFNCEGQNGGNNGGIMMYNYCLDHRDLGEQFLVLIEDITKITFCTHEGHYKFKVIPFRID